MATVKRCNVRLQYRVLQSLYKQVFWSEVLFKIVLSVLGLPVVTIDSNEYLVNYGNTATLRCTVNANPTQTSVAWQKIQNGVPSNVVVSGRYQGGTTSSPSLIISNVDNSDEGFYICSATNSVGTGQSSHTYLDVQGSKYI
jgi:hypothetical protein